MRYFKPMPRCGQSSLNGSDRDRRLLPARADLVDTIPLPIYSSVTDLRVNNPGLPFRLARERKRRRQLSTDGKLALLAVDHVARMRKRAGRSVESSMVERGFDLVLIGRAGVDLYSLDFGRTIIESKKFAKYVGGTAANVAVGASRLGLRAALVTRVGDDDLGEYVIGYLRKEGVDVNHVRKDGNGKTGIVFAEISPGRDGKFVFYREGAADLLIQDEDVPPGLIRRTKALIVTGTGLSSNPSARTINHAMKLAKEQGVMLILNLDWRPSLWSLPEQKRIARYARAIRMADVLIGNEGEYVAATGARDARRAVEDVRSTRKKVVVVTRGEKGSTVYSGHKEFAAPGFKVKHLKGLGGGDGFIAGFLYGVLKKWSLARAARFGNAVGAIVVTGHACSESMPTYSEVTKFLRSGRT